MKIHFVSRHVNKTIKQINSLYVIFIHLFTTLFKTHLVVLYLLVSLQRVHIVCCELTQTTHEGL